MVTTVHVPILVEPIVKGLMEPFERQSKPHWLVDCTLGGGGHTAALLEKLPKHHKMLSIDRDSSAIERGKKRFSAEIAQGRLELVHTSFRGLPAMLKDRDVLGMMADLGFSSDQMDDPSRGLSFQGEGPLDMRLDPSQGMTLKDYLHEVTEAELMKVIEEYGEERFARRIASAIVTARREKKLPKTTHELSNLIVRALPPFARHGRIHASTRTFQALRIAVNEEMEELDCLLKDAILFLKPGGRVAILSFHSLEDRKVKHAFRSMPEFEPTTKKPLEASEEEVATNPRSRSAKLRIAERLS